MLRRSNVKKDSWRCPLKNAKRRSKAREKYFLPPLFHLSFTSLRTLLFIQLFLVVAGGILFFFYISFWRIDCNSHFFSRNFALTAQKIYHPYKLLKLIFIVKYHLHLHWKQISIFCKPLKITTIATIKRYLLAFLLTDLGGLTFFVNTKLTWHIKTLNIK